MHKRFKIFSSITLILLAMLIICCNSNANNKIVNKNIIPFIIVFKVMPNKYCTGSVYTITDEEITIDINEDKRTKPGEFNCIQKRAHQKNLEKTENLLQLVSMNVEELKALPHEGCEGGVSHGITIKKEGKVKEIYYGGCAKEFDNNTKMIVNYINSQVPGKYKIDL